MLALIGVLAIGPAWEVFIEEPPVGVSIAAGGDVVAVATKREAIFYRRGRATPTSRVRYRLGRATVPVMLSPKGTQVAVLDSGAIKLYDPETGRLMRTIKEPQCGTIDGFHQMAFSPDGKTIAGARGFLLAGETLQLFDSQTGKEGKRLFNDVEWHVSSLEFALDARTLAVTCFEWGDLLGLGKKSDDNWAFTRFDVAKGVPLERREVAPTETVSTLDDDAVAIAGGAQIVGPGRGTIAAFAEVPGWVAIARKSGGVEVWAVHR